MYMSFNLSTTKNTYMFKTNAKLVLTSTWVVPVNHGHFNNLSTVSGILKIIACS